MLIWEVVFAMGEVFRWYCYHQIEMTSFIKLFPVIRFFLLQLMLGKVSSFCCLINMMLNFNVYNWFCVDMCWGVCFGRRRVAFLLWPIFFLLLRWILFAKMPSSCVPSGGKIWNQDCCFPCIFHLCWGWVIHILGGVLFPGVFAIFYSYQKAIISVTKLSWWSGWIARC